MTNDAKIMIGLTVLGVIVAIAAWQFPKIQSVARTETQPTEEQPKALETDEKSKKEEREKEKAALAAAEARIKELEEHAATGKINSVRVDHNVFNNGFRGMLIHINFDVNNFRNAKCSAAAYFEHASGEMLRSSDGRYEVASNGQVVVSAEFVPPYVNTNYEDLILFIPYEEVHIPQGTHHLRFKVLLYRQGGKFFAESVYYGFTLTK